jgi:transcriptional regulator of arginine metabolism
MRYDAHGFAERADIAMPIDHEHRESRQKEILAILDSQRVTSQGELVERLRERGVAATQSSVSRDLRDLGVGWIGGRYALPVDTAEREERDPGVAEVSRFLRGVKPAGPYLAVVLTLTGTAQAVAAAIDGAAWPEIAGTMAGDDTVFVATASANDQKRFIRRLDSFLKEG